MVSVFYSELCNLQIIVSSYWVKNITSRSMRVTYSLPTHNCAINAVKMLNAPHLCAFVWSSWCPFKAHTAAFIFPLFQYNAFINSCSLANVYKISLLLNLPCQFQAVFSLEMHNLRQNLDDSRLAFYRLSILFKIFKILYITKHFFIINFFANILRKFLNCILLFILQLKLYFL
jgi:hypothetical protein